MYELPKHEKFLSSSMKSYKMASLVPLKTTLKRFTKKNLGRGKPQRRKTKNLSNETKAD